MSQSPKNAPSGSANPEVSTDTSALQRTREAAQAETAEVIATSLGLGRTDAEAEGTAVLAVASYVYPRRFNPQYSEYAVGMPSFTVVDIDGPDTSLQNDELTDEGRALAPRLLALPGVVSVRLRECKIMITKAELFSWDQIDAGLLPLLRGEASIPAPVPVIIRHVPAPNPEVVVVQTTVPLLAAAGSGIVIKPGETADDILRKVKHESVATRSLLADLASLPGIDFCTMHRYDVMVAKHPGESTERLASAIEARLTAYAEAR